MSRIRWTSERLGRALGHEENHSDETLVDAWESDGLVERVKAPTPVEDRSMAGPAANRAMKSKKGDES